MERRADAAGAPHDQPSLWGSHDPFEDTAPQPIVVLPPAVAPAAAAPAAGPTAPTAEARGGRRSRSRRGAAGWVAAAVVAVLALGAGGGWALTRPSGPDTAAAATPTPSGALVAGAPSAATPSTSTAPLAASQPTLVLGDSLALVVYPYLADLLPDRYVTYVAEVGRSTAKIASALEAEKSIPPVVIVSAGTNDQLASDIGPGAARILAALGPKRCVVWVDVVRPDAYGDPASQVNAAIDAAVAGHRNVSVLRWSAMVAAHPEYLAHDGIHPTEAGAKARAQAYADASKGCSPVDPAAPKAKRQVLPDSIFWGPISNSGGNGSGSSNGSGSGSGNGSSTTSSNGSGSSKRSSSPSPQRSSASAKPTPVKSTPTAKPTTPPPAPTPAATTNSAA